MHQQIIAYNMCFKINGKIKYEHSSFKRRNKFCKANVYLLLFLIFYTISGIYFNSIKFKFAQGSFILKGKTFSNKGDFVHKRNLCIRGNTPFTSFCK